jgi:hypothetical protein
MDAAVTRNKLSQTFFPATLSIENADSRDVWRDDLQDQDAGRQTIELGHDSLVTYLYAHSTLIIAFLDVSASASFEARATGVISRGGECGRNLKQIILWKAQMLGQGGGAKVNPYDLSRYAVYLSHCIRFFER